MDEDFYAMAKLGFPLSFSTRSHRQLEKLSYPGKKTNTIKVIAYHTGGYDPHLSSASFRRGASGARQFGGDLRVNVAIMRFGMRDEQDLGGWFLASGVLIIVGSNYGSWVAFFLAWRSAGLMFLENHEAGGNGITVSSDA